MNVRGTAAILHLGEEKKHGWTVLVISGHILEICASSHTNNFLKQVRMFFSSILQKSSLYIPSDLRKSLWHTSGWVHESLYGMA